MDHSLQVRSLLRSAIAALAICVAIQTTTFANHGPGTSGGGSSTASGETLRPGALDFSLRADYTKFNEVSRDEAEQRAIASDEFDALETATVTTFGLAYGVVENFEVGAQIGYYWGNNFIDAEADGLGGAESAVADPKGLTDLTLSGKYRFMQGQPGNISVIGGVILPVGKDNELLDNGERLEPSSQPGTGEFGVQGGLAYSRFLTSHITIDASGIYTYRFERDDFQVGDRLDLGVALAYRLTESIQDFPNISVFGELNGIWIGKDKDSGASNPNSGGWTVYVTPGLRMRVNQNVAITVAPSIPILQELNGDQIETSYKLALTAEVSF